MSGKTKSPPNHKAGRIILLYRVRIRKPSTLGSRGQAHGLQLMPQRLSVLYHIRPTKSRPKNTFLHKIRKKPLHKSRAGRSVSQLAARAWQGRQHKKQRVSAAAALAQPLAYKMKCFVWFWALGLVFLLACLPKVKQNTHFV